MTVDEIFSVMIHMKAIEQYLPVVLFVMIYKVILMFVLWDEILKCEHSLKPLSNQLLWCRLFVYTLQTNCGFFPFPSGFCRR